MRPVTTSLVEEAKSIFQRLGYEVEESGPELRATRKWRTVYVTTVPPEDAPTHGDLRCFVARADRAYGLRDTLLQATPEYDWAVIGVDEDGDYEVLHPDPDVLPAP